MSEDSVVLRNPKNNQQKNTDGYRTDSGCFEDVDLQMANRHSPMSACSESVAKDHMTCDGIPEQCEDSTYVDHARRPSSLADECADDKDFHDILKRLSDITGGPSQLYRLCFNSRMSFCGHAAGGIDDSTGETQREVVPVDKIVEESVKNSCTLERNENGEDQRSNHGEQCDELISLLSTFMKKAKENANILSHPSLGNSFTAQLSSLVSSMEEVKQKVTADHVESNTSSCSNQNDSTTSVTVDHANEDTNDQMVSLNSGEYLKTTSNDCDEQKHDGIKDCIRDETICLSKRKEVNILNERSSSSSSNTDDDRDNSTTNDDDVVTIGRRAVKPYSWDYGDMWKTSSESLLQDEIPRYCEGDIDEMSFEEIRDDLFYEAGIAQDVDHHKYSHKRRSRSMDTRRNERNHRFYSLPRARNIADSPFVRTIYQEKRNSRRDLSHSLKSQRNPYDPILISVDWTRGRETKVFTNSNAFDDVTAQNIIDAAIKTSTYRGPKPWSVLKRRPSGLRRRSTRNVSCRSSTCSNESLTKVDLSYRHSLRSTSSDCLTTASDEGSTSSPYYASSSSSSVSNRNSDCFSDISTSDSSDIRRVVFQGLPSELSSHDHLGSSGLTLNERFRLILMQAQRNSTDSLSYPSQYSATLNRNSLNDRLITRSESEMNHLTKVQFVGDSYSRSHISKNIRYSRSGSRSSSPAPSNSACTRVLSCEIMRSDNKRQDVYTKVNIAGSMHDDLRLKMRNNKFGTIESRQSWHGQPFSASSKIQSNQRISTLPNRKHSRVNYDDRPLKATLVAVNNPTPNTLKRSLSSTGSLRMPTSERNRCYSDMSVIARNLWKPRNNATTQRRPPPDYCTAVKRSQSLQEQSNCATGHFDGKMFSSEQWKEREAHSSANVTKQLSSSVKLTSIGPSSLKNNPITNSSFVRTRRSRSLNEKDSISRRRLLDSDTYRKRAIEMSLNNRKVEQPSQLSRYGITTQSDVSCKRRHSSETRDISNRDDLILSGVVDDVVVAMKSSCTETNEDGDDENKLDHQIMMIQTPSETESNKRVNHALSSSDDVKNSETSSKQTELGLNEDDNNNVTVKDSSILSQNDLSDVLSIVETKDDGAVPSSVLPNSKTRNKSSDVNVFIDYRNKRPVSVEYTEEDVSFLKILGNTARNIRKDRKSAVKTGRNNTSCFVLDIEESNEEKVDLNSGLSQSGLVSECNTLQTLSTIKDELAQQETSQPYRRDNTIVYTDARTSFCSDTDSISRDSTVSSSGSDMTVILHEDRDISEDLKQLTESGSKIGIEITPIQVETGDDKRNSYLGELPPAMELSNTFTNYRLKMVDIAISPPDEDVFLKETPLSKLEELRRINNVKLPVEKNEILTRNSLTPQCTSNLQSSTTSIASSRASSKGTETECSKDSSKNRGGKGFFSRLKNFRNSFRGKRSNEGSKESLRSSNTSVYANQLSKPGTKSESEISRRSCDAFRPLDQRVAVLKSISSDQLHKYRVNSMPISNDVTAKSLEILVETCI